MLHYLGKYGTVTGLDIYKNALTMAQSHFNGALVHGTVDQLPFKDAQFNLVAIIEVLYHQNVRDIQETVNELFRVLRPGGYLVIVDSAYRSLSSAHDLAAHMKQRFIRPQLCKIAETAGLKVIHATYAYTILLPVVWAARKLKALAGSNEKPESELKSVHPVVNTLIRTWLWLEAQISGRWGLPFGLSIQVLAQKI